MSSYRYMLVIALNTAITKGIQHSMGCVVSIEVIRMVEGTLLPMAEHNRDLERQVMRLRQKADYLRDFGSWTRAAKNSFFFGGDTTGGVTQHTKAFDVIDTPVGFSQRPQLP